MVELDNMKSEIQTYQIPLQEVSASLDLENKEKRIEELEMEMQSPNFWDDPEISNKKMKESKNLKDTVDTMHGLLNQYRDIIQSNRNELHPADEDLEEIPMDEQGVTDSDMES